MNTHVRPSTIAQPPTKARVQFSLRVLFIVFTVLSAVMAIAVSQPLLLQFAAIAIVSFGIVRTIIWLTTFISSDYRQELAFAAWVLFGLFFLRMSAMFWETYGGGPKPPSPLAMMLMPIAFACYCYFRACHMLIQARSDDR